MNRLLLLFFMALSLSVASQNTFKVTYDFAGNKSGTVVGSSLLTANDAESGSVNGKITASSVEDDNGVLAFKNTVFENNATNYKNSFVRMDLMPVAGKRIRITKITVTQRASHAQSEGAYFFRIGCSQNGLTPLFNDDQTTGNIGFTTTYKTASFVPGLSINSAEEANYFSVWLTARGAGTTGSDDSIDWFVDKVVIEGVETPEFNFPSDYGESFTVNYPFTTDRTAVVTGTENLTAGTLSQSGAGSGVTAEGKYYLKTWKNTNTVKWGGIRFLFDLTPSDGYFAAFDNYEFVVAGSGTAEAGNLKQIGLLHNSENADPGSVSHTYNFENWAGENVFGDDVEPEAFRTVSFQDVDENIYGEKHFFRMALANNGPGDSNGTTEILTVDEFSITGRLLSQAQADLWNAAKAAKDKLNLAVLGVLQGEYKASVYADFQMAVEAAFAVLNNAAATEVEIESALTAINAATDAFSSAANTAVSWSIAAETTDWATPENWDGGAVPTATTDVVISGQGAVLPVVDGMAYCKSLNLESDALLTLTKNGMLEVAENITNNEGASALVLHYDKDSDAQLKFMGSTQATIVHTVPVCTASGWLPFATGLVSNAEKGVSAWSTDMGAGSLYLDTHSEVTNAYSTVGTTLNPLTGYFIYSTSGHQLHVTGTISGDAPTFGTLGVTDSDKGFHLLANPHTTKVDVAMMELPDTHFEQGIWVYDGVDAFTVLPKSGIIQPGSSFFVRAATAGGTIGLPAEARTMGEAKKNNTLTETINIDVLDGQETDHALIRVVDQALATKDNYDLSKIFSLKDDHTAVFSTVGTQAVAVNSIPADFEGIIPIRLRIGESGKTSLTLSKANWFGAAHTIVWVNGEAKPFVDEFTYTATGEVGEEVALELEFTKKALAVTDQLTGNLAIRMLGNTLHIQQNEAKQAQVKLYNLQGSVLFTKTITNQISQTALSLPAGVYMVSVKSGSAQKTQKILVQP